ncbi:MAG: 50S ribosomal protein L35 [Candidatus Colwellbacteria bacterium CG10_big_fil_rev_8_21_14_0_10_42_22]|uniref:50S ribosomal protein L35 n=1 Tax=Candidatus Colwellbacteria bacterium CG10_big_fil_rev_8_21_14_0_10_42_22 TaxID=1974540 RepID=A0A2H0VHV5_9BACT|nr:MAG: 50S ribosomal protein L35 [Candidatus Colwellbacteria bacterium CG10_big_fil_rev_8_21_14_0_10_42_22]
MAKKSYTKRIKVTKTGKLLRRKKGLGHNRSKKKTKVVNQKRNMSTISRADRSNINAKLN